MPYKRPDSPYFWISYMDQHGRQRRESTGVTSKTLAKQIEAARRADVFSF